MCYGVRAIIPMKAQYGKHDRHGIILIILIIIIIIIIIIVIVVAVAAIIVITIVAVVVTVVAIMEMDLGMVMAIVVVVVPMVIIINLPQVGKILLEVDLLKVKKHQKLKKRKLRRKVETQAIKIG